MIGEQSRNPIGKSVETYWMADVFQVALNGFRYIAYLFEDSTARCAPVDCRAIFLSAGDP